MTHPSGTFALYNASALAKTITYLETGPNTSLLKKSLLQTEHAVAGLIQRPLDVPGQGEAGSYEHHQHKSNYELMDDCAKLYAMTGETRYKDTVLDLLLMYADTYLSMPFHEQKNTNPPGRLFHQILNEHMWLFYAALAYSSIKDSISEADQTTLEGKLFIPMIDMFTNLYGHDFDRIHNHGLWAVAAVGITGLVVGDEDAVHKSIYGMLGDGTTGGFLAQISQLFSASGYYIEGPYYHRFAIRPLVIFAEAINLHFPNLDIYNYNDQVIGKTIKALLVTSNPDGTFPALNDASLTMDINDEGAKASLAVYVARYGKDDVLTAVAKKQNTLWLSPVSMALSQAVDEYTGEASVRWPTIELTEGVNGEKGAQGFLRSRDISKPVTQAIMGYGQHGMGHGHFDTLSITLYAAGHEFIREYGFGRWVNVETKFGGRYLEENKSWARQTVAHNCVTVDQKCQNEFNVDRADGHYGKPHFFVSNSKIQATSAYANDHYDDVKMQRTVAIFEHEHFENPIVIDLFRLESEEQHQYDFPIHYRGQVTSCDVPYNYKNTSRELLGDANGYQHLFEVARGTANDTSSLTWLQGRSFHSWTSNAEQGEFIFAQTGGNDPEMNLRTENCVILRKNEASTLFASVYETHGLFDESTERCFGANSQITTITTLQNNAQHSIVEINYQHSGQSQTLIVCVNNDETHNETTPNNVKTARAEFSWNGSISVQHITGDIS